VLDDGDFGVEERDVGDEVWVCGVAAEFGGDEPFYAGGDGGVDEGCLGGETGAADEGYYRVLVLEGRGGVVGADYVDVVTARGC